MTTIALTGDSILQRRLLSTTDPELVPLFDIIRGADAAFTNLEVLPNDYKGHPAKESGGSHFGAPSWVLDELVDAGFTMFSTPTNHSLDYSISGLEYALDQLDLRKLCHAGCGRNLEEARQVSYYTGPKATVGMVCCTSTFSKGQEAGRQTAMMQGRPGVNPLRLDEVYEVRPEQLDAIKAIAEGLGLEKRRQLLIDLGFYFSEPDGIAVLNGLKFRAGDTVRHECKANEKDVRDILRWLEEATLLSDIAMVSVHAHEQGETNEDPADFIRDFAHASIDAGADLVVGHGPHILRGIEIYKEKPIFYSLGNFIGQNEMVRRLPGDSYDRFRADDSLTPGALYKKRTDDDRLGFPSDSRYWQTVVPICRYEGDRLSQIRILPVSLGLGEARHRRGRPRLAHGSEGAAILSRLAAMSKKFGTNLVIEGDEAFVALGDGRG